MVIVTEQQRRWWFATHPEFSTGSSGHGSRGHGGDDDEEEGSGRPSPESVDGWANERLSYETDNVRRTLVELAKFYFGTEFQSKTPAEKEAILEEDEDATGDEDEPSNAEGNDWWSQQPADTHAPEEDSSLTYKDVLDWLYRRRSGESTKEAFMQKMMDAGWSREKAEDRWKVYELNRDTARSFSDAMSVYGLGAGARAILGGLSRRLTSLGEVGAVGKSAEPGKWVEVVRPRGIEHQSKMSGKPIIKRDGKLFIEEYEVNNIKFDDYKNGALYEYKGPQGNLINKNGVFYDVIEKSMGLRDDAFRQANAAQGIPVIWRVGRNQVKAFRKAVGNVPGVIIVP